VNNQTSDPTLNAQLSQLIIEACSFPPRSLGRRSRLEQAIRIIQQSEQLWIERTPEYEDALQQTWLFLCRNPEKYDPERGEVIPWLNTYLKYRLKDKQILNWEEQKKIVQSSAGFRDPVEELPSPEPIPPMLDEVLQWIKAGEENQLCTACLRGRPEVNCQALLLRRLPPEVSWETIAAEFGLKSISSIAMLHKRKCLPMLREFGKQQGYL